ncbi:MAG: hypothetical protein GF398_09620 [Chitinivibrionales bacterium]|nr:hypothetical protein [Chitinivibrionales bacterium]
MSVDVKKDIVLFGHPFMQQGPAQYLGFALINDLADLFAQALRFRTPVQPDNPAQFSNFARLKLLWAFYPA